MHVLHVSHLCHLTASFGTERYQYDLIAESRRLGVRGTLLWLAADAVASQAGAQVRVVPAGAASPEPLGAVVDAVLRADPPSLLHFHSLGPAESVVARRAGAHRIPYVFTYHTPWSLCANGSLLRWGTTVCDGAVRPWRCSACRNVELLRALPRGLRLGRLRQWAAQPAPLAAAHPRGMRRRAQALREFLAGCARVLLHADPARGVLLANGVRPEVLAICPPGVSPDFAAADHRRAAPASGAPFVVGYVGRLDRLKGFGILVEAFLRTTWTQARLRLVGVTPHELRLLGHASRVIERARRDSRIEFVAMRPLISGAALYDGLTVLAIPSIGVETGPLVLREALQLGLPVLASDRLGEPLLVRAHARVVAPNTVAAWAGVLEGLFDEARRGVFPAPVELAPSDPARRTMRAVADDVLAEYESILHPTSTPSRNAEEIEHS